MSAKFFYEVKLHVNLLFVYLIKIKLKSYLIVPKEANFNGSN